MSIRFFLAFASIVFANHKIYFPFFKVEFSFKQKRPQKKKRRKVSEATATAAVVAALGRVFLGKKKGEFRAEKTRFKRKVSLFYVFEAAFSK